MSQSGQPLLDVLGDVHVAVSARFGLANVPLSVAAAIAEGSVIPLDCPPDAPVTLLVNGVAIARGELVVTDDGILAVEISEVQA